MALTRFKDERAQWDLPRRFYSPSLYDVTRKTGHMGRAQVRDAPLDGSVIGGACEIHGENGDWDFRDWAGGRVRVPEGV